MHSLRSPGRGSPEGIQNPHPVSLPGLPEGLQAVSRQIIGFERPTIAAIDRYALGAFKRAGIVVIENANELFPAAETPASLPPIRNNKVAILADAFLKGF